MSNRETKVVNSMNLFGMYKFTVNVNGVENNQRESYAVKRTIEYTRNRHVNCRGITINSVKIVGNMATVKYSLM